MSQEQFYPLVFSFRYAIRLGMKGGGYVLFDTQALAQRFCEVGGETGVPVGDDLCR